MPFGFSIRKALGLIPTQEPAPVRRRSYGGAMLSRLTADWVSQGTSQDAEARSSLIILRNRARQLVRDSDYARQAVRAFRNNVVGTGVQFQSQVRMQRGGGRLDTALNDAIEKAWGEWCRKDSVDVAGLLCFSEIERLAISSVITDGEVFIRIYRQSVGRSKVPLALQVIEADLLDDNYNGVGENGNEIRMGVEVSSDFRRPVAYHFFQKHPGDFQYGAKGNPYQKRIRVPAEEILHLFQVERPGQTRGVSAFASALTTIHHMEGFAESELISARAGAALMGFVTSPEGSFPEDDVMDGQRVLDWSPGQWKYLAPGESVDVPNLQRPDSFEPFMRQCLRSVAAGLGVSYETVSRDFSQTNYSSSRLSLLEDRDNYRAIQNWLIENLHQTIYDKWLDMAALSNVVNLPGYESDPTRYNCARWLPRGWAWVDPKSEVESFAKAVRCGFMTQADVIAQTGGDIDEVFTARAREIELAQEMGLVFDTDPAAVNQKGQEQVPMTEPPADPTGSTPPPEAPMPAAVAAPPVKPPVKKATPPRKP
jgi:lambda family phage portal protein